MYKNVIAAAITIIYQDAIINATTNISKTVILITFRVSTFRAFR